MGSKQINSGSFEIGKCENAKLNIDELSKEDLADKIKEVQRIRIPFFDNAPLQLLSNVVYVTGNSPHHEGLIFKTEKGNFYVAQTYPITFEKVSDYDAAIYKITYFCNLNKYSKNNKIRDVWVPERKRFSVNALKLFIETLPNKYDLIQENCQFFCKEILEAFPLKKLEEEEYNFIIKGSKTV
jgi:hypothetical protein